MQFGATFDGGRRIVFHQRRNVFWHDGLPFTAEDVKFTFERYKGLSAAQMKERVRAVEVVDPERVRFVLKRVWKACVQCKDVFVGCASTLYGGGSLMEAASEAADAAKDLAADSAMEAGKDKVKELGMTLLRGKEEDKPKRAYVGAVRSLGLISASV
jgi:hypothetical protein